MPLTVEVTISKHLLQSAFDSLRAIPVRAEHLGNILETGNFEQVTRSERLMAEVHELGSRFANRPVPLKQTECDDTSYVESQTTFKSCS
jgi:hypothetical protein